MHIKQYPHSYVKSQRQLGVGMIEILITLFILSIGLLGVASLQFISAFSNADAMSRSQAVMVAQQFSERLRANATMSSVSNGLVVDNTYFDSTIYNFNNLTCASSARDYQCFCQSLPADIPDCRSGECSGAEFAIYDGYEVSCAAAATNPGTEVALSCEDNDTTDTDSCSPGSRHEILLSWPVESWQNQNRILNSACGGSSTDPKDCVILELTL